MYDDIGAYLENQVSSASPAKLIQLLFERAIRDLTTADELLGPENDKRSRADGIRLVVHAQQIIAELQRSLDFGQSRELALNLLRVYEYMQYRLNQAVAGDRRESISEVTGLLSDLQDAWSHVEDTPEQVKSSRGAGMTAMLVG